MENLSKINELTDKLDQNPSDFKIRRELAIELMESGITRKH